MLKYLSKFLWLAPMVGIVVLGIIFGIASGGKWLNILNLQVVTPQQRNSALWQSDRRWS